jgi:hypothetical protein
LPDFVEELRRDVVSAAEKIGKKKLGVRSQESRDR